MNKRPILVVGSLNMDQVVSVPSLPARGETLLGAGALKLIPGGKGANQAVAMARLGAPVTMAGRVGNDTFGKQLVAALHADGVNTELTVVDQEEATGVAFIFLTPERDNAIVVASGSNGRVGHDAEHFSQILQRLKQTQALVLQLEIPAETVSLLIAAAHEADQLVVLNLAPAQKMAPQTLQQVSVLILNEGEASLLSGQTVTGIAEAKAAATTLHKQGIATVVITLGSQGALLVTTGAQGETQYFSCTAPAVEVVDTTAAGDCFVGALTVALTEGQAAEDALRFAVLASALKVTKFGAQSGLPTRAEVEAFAQQQQKAPSVLPPA